jgi:hypothetical protein
MCDGARHAHAGQSGIVDVPGPYPFKGEVLWLTPEQGGRRTGPPPPDGPSYAQVAHVPPGTIDSGTASFVLRGFAQNELKSPAEGKWLVVENEGPQRVGPGSVVVITEGPTVVAYFTVHSVAT